MLRRKQIYIIIWLIGFISACHSIPEDQSRIGLATSTESPVKIVATPTLLPTETVTKMSISSMTATSTSPPNTPTPTATITPYPTLIALSPYLVYHKFGGHGPILVLNADFVNRKQIELPEDAYISNFNHAISPDGRWLAFYTGTTKKPYDLTLNLLSIPDGEIFPITKVLSDEYPENLSEVSEFYAQQGYEAIGRETLKSQVFDYAIETFEWSPNGNSLAFAGQMDGPSSDLYIYDLATEKINKITDDKGILKSISWSPNGDWLVIQNAIPGIGRNGATLHRIKANGRNVKNLTILVEGTWWYGNGWFSPNYYLISDRSSSGPSTDLRYLDVETGQIISLWPDVYEDFVIDEQTGLLWLSTAPSAYDFADNKQHSDDGLYIITIGGGTKKVTDDVYWKLRYRGSEGSSFIGWDGKKVVLISNDALTNTLINENRNEVSISPDKQWMILYGDQGVELYSAEDQLLRKISDKVIDGIAWQPDSLAMFITTGQQLYYVAIPDGDPIVVDQCDEEDDGCSFNDERIKWLP